MEQIGITVAQGDWRAPLARFGLVAKGTLFGALGVLAIQVARGDRAAGSVTQGAAMELVGRQPLGHWLIGVLGVGLLALALWQLLLAVTGDPVEGSSTSTRVMAGVKAVIYLSAGMSALLMLAQYRRGSASGLDTSESQTQLAASAMEWPGGPWLVGMVGASAIGLALYQAYAHAWHRKFMRRLDVRGMSPPVEKWVERAGRWGYGARAGVLGVIGLFLIAAARQHDAAEAVGIGAVLAYIASQSWGDAGLWFIAIGLFAYGGFCIAEARFRRAV